MSAEQLFGDLRVGGGSGISSVDRIDNQGRRYNMLLVALRAAHPTWNTETVREEARRILKKEDLARPPWKT